MLYLFLRRVATMAVAAFLVLPTSASEPLPVDPAIRSGQFANGLRWMYRHHPLPPGKFSILLHVDSGSLNETDEQRGLAHFIEHMCFNGTENFPPGELLPYFESIGMEFGADLNASTGFDTTSYMLFLPNTELDGVEKALTVLSDFAFRAKMTAEEIDKERDVILAEKRARNNVAFRVQEQVWQELYAETRFAQRLPIGVEEVIRGASRDQFMDYYKTWYRPERMTLMLVGDAELEPILPLAEKWFAAEKTDAPPREPKTAELSLPTAERVVVVADPEYKLCQISAENLLPPLPPLTTVEALRADLVSDLGVAIYQRRLGDRLKKGNAAYHSAGASVSNFFNEGREAQAFASGEPKNWEKMLAEIIEELQRVQEHGFSPRELDLAKANALAAAERAARTESTQNANSFLFRMSASVTSGDTLMSARQRLELVQRLLPAIDVAEVAATFKAEFSPGKYAYVLKTSAEDGAIVPTRDDILAAARAALARKTAPPVEPAETKSLLAQMPEAGNVVESEMDEELGVTSLWLSNGVRVHHRFMDYKKDQVLVSINLAGGTIEETGDLLGVSEVAAIALSQPATHRLDSTEIVDLMTGRNVAVSGANTMDSLTLRVRGAPRDLEHGLQLAYALLTDGLIEEPAFDNWQRTRIQQMQLLRSFPEVQAGLAMRKLTSGDDPRVDIADESRFERQTREAGQRWLERLCAGAPMEVAIVGEVPLEEAVRLACNYMGSLPPRPRSADSMDTLRKLNRPKGPLARHTTVETTTNKAVAMLGFMSADARDVADNRALQIAQQVLTSRLIKRIREELALVYSIRAQNAVSRVFRDDSTFMTTAPCAPENAARVIEEARQLFVAFAETGPTDDELANAKKQILNNLDTQMKEPAFWWNVLENLDYHKRDLSEIKRIRDAIETTQGATVVETFRKYFVPERTFEVIAAPPSAESPSKPGENTGGNASHTADEKR